MHLSARIFISAVFNFRGYTSYLTSTPIWLDNLFNCNSYSSDLRQCTQAVGVNDCSHSEDIVLTCSQGIIIYYTKCISDLHTWHGQIAT